MRQTFNFKLHFCFSHKCNLLYCCAVVVLFCCFHTLTNWLYYTVGINMITGLDGASSDLQVGLGLWKHIIEYIFLFFLILMYHCMFNGSITCIASSVSSLS